MDVLISGASVSGPVAAYWLRRAGFRVTVVERAPALRKAGGHAVDLFTPALGIVERMGVLDEVQARRTGTDRMVVLREGAPAAGGDPRRAFPAYEAAMADYVERSRAFAVTMARRLVPGSRAATWAMTSGVKLFTVLPTALARRLWAAGDNGLHDTVAVRDSPELMESVSDR